MLRVPTSALFRRGDAWAVYVVAGGRARVRAVTLGQRTGQEAEVLDGLADGEVVVLHPGDSLTDGTRVAPHGRDDGPQAAASSAAATTRED